MVITVAPNDKIKVGSVVEIFVPNLPIVKNKLKRMSGKWLVSAITHKFNTLRNYTLSLTLTRDSVDYDVNTAEEPVSIFDRKSYEITT